uniref:Uncharacterized protein n=1 Tax=viral metagenome TaxID=1070528 RepID=A0A6C0H1A8_9ZZZZ
MSLEGDTLVFENSVRDNSEPVLFNEKKYNFITDSTSNSGQFSSGQIQFDLSTFSSQNWVSLSEAVVEFPVKITAQLTTAGAGGTTGTQSAGIFAAVCKNGYHQWINSAQLIINGQTIQSQQPYENVSASFRILKNWSQDTLRKWGLSCGVAIDDITGDSEVATTYNTTIGLNNATYSTVATSIRGFDAVNNQNVLFNKGVSSRMQHINNNIASTTVGGRTIGSSGYKNAGKSNVGVASASNSVNTYLHSQFVMATVRVKDLFDIDQFPLCKNIKGYMYLTFNSFQVQLTGGLNTSGSITSVNVTPLTGLTCPFNVIYDSNGGVQLSNTATTTAPIITIIGTIDGTSNNNINSSGPLISNARLVMPYYSANPNTDSALSKVQSFKTLEKIVNPFTMAAGETKNFTITVGVSNPTKLVLLPMYQNLGGASYLNNPEVSPFDTVPATSSPFAKLDNIQVYVANKPLFQYPIQYDYEHWIMNGVQEGANSGLVDEMTSGLLTQQLWEQNHRYYVFDLQRRLKSDDGMSRSVQISCTNGSPTSPDGSNPGFGMKVIAILFYEKNWDINTATCAIQSA